MKQQSKSLINWFNTTKQSLKVGKIYILNESFIIRINDGKNICERVNSGEIFVLLSEHDSKFIQGCKVIKVLTKTGNVGWLTVYPEELVEVNRPGSCRLNDSFE